LLILGNSVAGVENLGNEHHHGGVACTRLLERVEEPVLHAVANHMRQRLPIAKRYTSVGVLHAAPRLLLLGGEGGGGEGLFWVCSGELQQPPWGKKEK
jgi:hypothetical protein